MHKWEDKNAESIKQEQIKRDLEEQATLIRRERKENNAWHKFRRNKVAVAGLVIVSIILFMGIFADFISPYDPNTFDILNMYAKPGTPGHPFGTDELGRDLLSRIIYGARTSVVIAVGSTCLGGLIGILLGMIAGYVGGALDSVLMRIMDGMSAFPYMILAVSIATILGPGEINVILALGIGVIPGFARTIRSEVLKLKHEESCNAERVLGASRSRILFRHILPNALSPLIVYATLHVASAIISEAGLSFLGLGIVAPTASWGNIIRSAQTCISTAPHIAVISGAFILIAVVGFNLVGDGIRDVFDPKMKR